MSQSETSKGVGCAAKEKVFAWTWYRIGDSGYALSYCFIASGYELQKHEGARVG